LKRHDTGRNRKFKISALLLCELRMLSENLNMKDPGGPTQIQLNCSTVQFGQKLCGHAISTKTGNAALAFEYILSLKYESEFESRLYFMSSLIFD
jgi:hypothetical protein